jgi:hypothetical protein
MTGRERRIDCGEDGLSPGDSHCGQDRLIGHGRRSFSDPAETRADWWYETAGHAVCAQPGLALLAGLDAGSA